MQSGLAAVVVTLLLGFLTDTAIVYAQQTNFSTSLNARTGSDCSSSTLDQSCPGTQPTCFCYSLQGVISGAVGAGYGQTDIHYDSDLTSTCHPFNASTFLVGTKDVAQIDYQGSICGAEPRSSIVGNYHIERSARGRTESGKVAGAIVNSRITLHFIPTK